ncbi:HAD family hydrolase [Latilactobacillus sakei]|uniref:HAD family hydrolase n=1 Tax=Latilactobacillus sakei TaxID=1599 RepID=UPI00388A0623
MTVKGVIFDVDGILVNSETYYFEQRLTFLNAIGAKLTVEESRRQIGSNMNAVLKQVYPGRTMNDYAMIKEGYRSYKRKHPIRFDKILNQDAQTLLAEIAPKYQIGLASAGERQIINQMLDETKLTPYFETIVSGAETAHNKPAPDVYTTAIAQLGLKSDEAVAIEDSEFGIKAGKAAGLTVIALKPLDSQFKINQEEADYRVESLTEVPAILAQLS